MESWAGQGWAGLAGLGWAGLVTFSVRQNYLSSSTRSCCSDAAAAQKMK